MNWHGSNRVHYGKVREGLDFFFFFVFRSGPYLVFNLRRQGKNQKHRQMKFVLSSPPFSGFEIRMNQDQILSLDHVVSKMRHELEEILHRYQLNDLIDLLKTKKWHIHDYELLDLLAMEDENHTWYICDCPS